MRCSLDADVVARIAAMTGRIVKAKGSTHPSLELVVFDLDAMTVSAANAGAIWVGTLGAAVEPDGQMSRWAIRQEHLAALAGLCPTGPKAPTLHLDAQGAELTATIGTDDKTIGTWTLPLAGARDLNGFPDEPETLAAETHGYAWEAGQLGAALSYLAPFASADGTLQATGTYLATATWAGAARATVPLGAGEVTHTVVLPGSAVPIIRAMPGRAPLAVSETDAWVHLRRFNEGTLHIAKLTQATDAILPTYFGTALVATDAVDLPGNELVRAIERASALATHVRLQVMGDELVVEAADGSSTQRIACYSGPGVYEANGSVYETGPLLGAVSRFDNSAEVNLYLPQPPRPLATIVQGSVAYALVPLAEPDDQ